MAACSGAAPEDDDPFDSLLNLESTYESQGYADGLRDGKDQAHISAKLFGIEKAFEKYVNMSRLRWRAECLAAEHGVPIAPAEDSDGAADGASSVSGGAEKPASRLQKHVATLLAFTSAKTMDCSNTDVAIGDFDERLRRAQAKVKVIERLTGVGAKREVKEDEAGLERASGVMGDGDIENPKLNLQALKLKHRGGG